MIISSNFKIAFAITFFLVFCETSFCQNKPVKFENLRFGFDPSRNSITCIIQDREGFIWFGTKFGLIKYDGSSSRTFFFDNKNPSSISGNFIRDIHEDKNGNLWIATSDNGISKYIKSSDKFEHLNLKTHFPNLPDINRVWAIQIIPNGETEIFWFGTAEGLIRYDISKNTFKLFDTNNSPLPTNFITELFYDSNQRIWIGTDNGIIIYDERENKFITQSNLSPIKEFIWRIREDNDKNIWFGTQDKGLFRVDKDLKTIEVINKQNSSLSDNRVLDIFNIPNSEQIFIGTWVGGLNIYNTKTKKIDSLSIKDGLASTSIISFFKDRSGIIWIGTEAGGVNYIYPNIKKFQSIENGLSATKDFLRVDNKMWIATTTDILIKSDSENSLMPFNQLYPNLKLTDDNFQALAKNRNGEIFIGTFWGGLNVLNLIDNKITQLLPTTRVSDLLVDSGENVWVATANNGVYKLNSSLKLIDHFTKENSKLNSNRAAVLFETVDKSICIGMNGGGVTIFNPKTADVSKLNVENNMLSNNFVTSFYEDTDGIIWIATNGGGIVKYDRNKNISFSFTELEGLAGNNAEGIIAANDSSLWISTTSGLSKFNISSGTFLNYFKEDGLLDNEFISGAVYKDNNTIFLGNRNGFSFFSPGKIENNNYIPPVYITSIDVFVGHSYSNIQITDLKSITLNHTQNAFTIKFAGLNYIFPKRNKYMYKLKGLDEDYRIETTHTGATYTNLNPGSYKFLVKASNNDGIWNPVPAALTITITAPFWKTVWFRILLGIFILSITAFLIWFRINHLLQIERLRLKIARDLHDEIGSTLTKLSMNAGLLEYEKEDEKIIIRIKRLQAISREVIGMMSDVVWSIDTRNDHIEDLIDRMRNHVANLRMDTNIEFIFESNISDKNQKLSIQKKKNILLIFKEALNNSIKYSKSNLINISITELESRIILSVKDNGIVVLDDDIKNGYGLRNMGMRAEEIKAELQFNVKDGFEVKLITHVK